MMTKWMTHYRAWKMEREGQRLRQQFIMGYMAAVGWRLFPGDINELISQREMKTQLQIRAYKDGFECGLNCPLAASIPTPIADLYGLSHYMLQSLGGNANDGL